MSADHPTDWGSNPSGENGHETDAARARDEARLAVADIANENIGEASTPSARPPRSTDARERGSAKDRQPHRDVPRDPDAPGFDGQIDAFLDPPRAQQAATELGTEAVEIHEDVLFGPDKLISESIGGETDVRIAAVELDHLLEIGEQEEIVATSNDRERKALDDGVAESQRAEHLEATKPQLEEAKHDAEQEVDQLNDELRRARDDEADVRAKIADQIEDASLVQRAPLKLQPAWIVVLLVVEILNQCLTLAPAYAEQITLSFVGQDILTAGVGGVIITLAATVAGVLLASLLPNRGGTVLLLVGLFTLAARAYAHIDALRTGADQFGLFLTDLSALGALATAAIACAVVINRDFGARIARRLATAALPIGRVLEELGEAKQRVVQATIALETVDAQIEAAKAAASAAQANAVGERIAGTVAEVKRDTLEEVMGTRVRSEMSFGHHRVHLAHIAHANARNTALPDPAGVRPVDAEPPPTTTDEPRQIGDGWLLGALAVLAAGGVAGLVAGRAAAFAEGAALAAALLIVGLLLSSRRRRDKADVQPADDAEVPRTVGLTGRNFWRHLPTSTRSRIEGTGVKPTDEI